VKAGKLVKEYEQLVGREPDNLVARLKLAAVLRELGQMPEALGQYRAVAETYHRHGRYLQALAVCRSALEIDPTDVQTRTLYQVIDAARSGAPEEESTHIAAEPPRGMSGTHAIPKEDLRDNWEPPTRPGDKDRTDKVGRLGAEEEVEEQDIVEELPREAERLVDAVLGQPSFRVIPAPLRAAVAARFQLQVLQGGVPVLRQGEPGGGLYAVVSGALRILRRSAGKDIEVGVLVAKSFFADLTLVRGEPSAATVVASGPGQTEIVFLAPRDFYDLCATVPAVWDDLRRRAQSQSFLVGERL
jgi:hypothetical protein